MSKKEEFEKAENFRNNSNYQEALKLFLEILIDDPNNALLYQGIAQCQYYLDQYQSATKASKSALEINPTLAIPHTILAYIYRQNGKLEESRNEAMQAIHLEPSIYESLICYGTILMTDGKLDEAKSHLIEALRINPNSNQAHYNLALIYESQSDWGGYLHEVKALYKIKPSFRFGALLFFALQRKYAIITAAIVTSFIVFALIFRMKIILVLPGIYLLRGVHICYKYFRNRQWRSAVTLTIASVIYFLLLFSVYRFIDRI